jgi:G3E family GTPase
VVRAKGFVHIAGHDDRRAVLHVVGRRAELRLDSPWGDEPPQTSIVCIAAADEIDDAGIVARFAECEVTEERVGPVKTAVRWMRDRIS